MINGNLNNQKLDHEKVLRDPVHSYIHVKEKVIFDVINAKEFQRLRRIKQLGPTSYVFPGATHTRFEHNLGVYELTRRICSIFEEKYSTKEPGDGLWDPKETLLAECAALLHDIGHGPYSHTFEHLFDTNHEKMGQQIIVDRGTEVNKALRQISPEFPEQVASVIAKTYPNPQVVKLISSQADADRMDYLLRDAYYTGVTYGAFDLTRILQVIRPFSDGICFTSKGVHAVEDYIISRYQMYQQVYFHRVNRSMEVILRHMLERAQLLHHEGKIQVTDQLALFLNNTPTLEAYLKLDDGVMETNFLMWTNSDDQILSDLASRYLYRRPFESIKISDNTKKLIPKLSKLIEEAGFNPQYYTATDSVYDEPYDAYKPSGKNAHSPIEIMQEDGTLIELSKVSTLVNSLSGTLQGDAHFFFPKTMTKEHNEPQIFDPIYQEFKKYIKNHTLQYIRQPKNKKATD